MLSKKEFRLFLTFFLIFSLFVHWNDAWDFNSSFALIKAVVEEGKFEIDSYHQTTEAKFLFQKHYYTTMYPGLTFLISWVYALVRNFSSIQIEKFSLVIFSNSLLASLSVILVYKISSFYIKDKKHRLFSALIYGIATPIFPYSRGLYPYIPAIFLAFLSFFIFLKERKTKFKNKKIFILTGIFLGVASSIHLFTILIACLLFFLILKEKKKCLLFFLTGYLLGFSPLLFYNISIFTCFQNILNYYLLFYLNYILNKPLLINIPFGNCPPLDVSKPLAAGWQPPSINILKILPRILFYPWNGIFFYYPILLFSIIGISNLYLKGYKDESIFIILLFVLTCLYSASYRWWGDLSFGPRRFLFSIPFLIIGLFPLFEKFGLKFIYPFFIFSFFVNLLSLQPWTSLECELGKNPNEIYIERVQNFQILKNVLIEKYFPLFLENGPRAPLFENLVFNGKFSIEIENDAIIPFLTLVPLTVLIILIWHKEFLIIFKKFKRNSLIFA